MRTFGVEETKTGDGNNRRFQIHTEKQGTMFAKCTCNDEFMEVLLQKRE